MTITVSAPAVPQTHTASPDETARLLRALALRQLPNHELRAAASFDWKDETFEEKLSDLCERGLIERWQTKKGAPRSRHYGPGWQLTHEGRKWLAAHLMAAAPVIIDSEKPAIHQPAKQVVSANSGSANAEPQGETPAARFPDFVNYDPNRADDQAAMVLAVLKAIAQHPGGASDGDVKRAVRSTNDRERAYAQLRVRGFIRPRPDAVMPRLFVLTPAGRAHLVALEPQPCRALVVRGCVALIVPSSNRV